MEARNTPAEAPDISALWQASRLYVTDTFTIPPVILRVDDSAIGTLGNFSASIGRAKSKKTFNVCAIVAAVLINGTVLSYCASLPEEKRKILYVDTEQSPYHCQNVLQRILQLSDLPTDKQPAQLEFLSLRKFAPDIRAKIIELAIYQTEGLGLVIVDGIRDLAYDINSPSEATDLITKLMRWTDERQLHLHTVLHLNKGDDNARGHLGTELNNKAETVLQITKDDMDKNVSSVAASYIRDVDFPPFAFRINEHGLPELLEDYQPKLPAKKTELRYNELPEAAHREALNKLYSKTEAFGYGELIDGLQLNYASIGYSFNDNNTKDLKKLLENKGIIVKKEGRRYHYNPDFHY